MHVETLERGRLTVRRVRSAAEFDNSLIPFSIEESDFPSLVGVSAAWEPAIIEPSAIVAATIQCNTL